MKKLLFLLAISGLFCNAQTIIDIDGNVYQTVTLETQVWMAENLRVARLNDGTDIPIISYSWDWEYMTSPAYCFYNNNQTLKATYGALYNWMAVNTGKLCPAGWHIPSEAEFDVMIQYLGGDSVAGGKLKETGTEHWFEPNTGATNESGFSARPGGLRGLGVDFYGMRGMAEFWTSTEVTITKARSYEINYEEAIIYKTAIYHYVGHSVRCLKDNLNDINNYQSENQVTISPNPTSDIFQVHGENITIIQLFDFTGRLIYSGHSSSIDISTLPDSVYFVYITTDKGVVIKKIVKRN